MRLAAAASCGVKHLVAVCREIPIHGGPLEAAIDRFAGRRASTVVAAFPAVRDYCVEHGIAAGRIEVIPSGTCKAAPSIATRGQILDRLGLPESARLIGWAGRLEADRGGKDAVWAADLLKVIRDDAHLLIFGDGPHRDRLVLFREQVEIADKVHFLGQRGATCKSSYPTSISSGPPAAGRGCRSHCWKPWPPACPSWPRICPARAS